MSFVSPAYIPLSIKQPIYDTLGYVPFGAQTAFHASNAMIRVLVAGNQSGKTFSGSREVIPQLLLPIMDKTTGTLRPRRGWIVVPRYTLGEPILNEIHNVLQGSLGVNRVKRITDLGDGEYHYSISRHELTTWLGAKLWIKSADEPTSLHAYPLDWILIDEAALVPFEVVQTNLMPRLTVTGGWLSAIGTFESTLVGQWFVDYWRIGQTHNEQSIESFRHPTTENPYVNHQWLEAQKALYDPDLFAARFMAIPKPDERLVFRNFSYITHVDADRCRFDPELPVYLAVDPGGIYALLAVQIKYFEGLGECVCVIDEIYDTGGGPTDKMIDTAKDREWFKNVGTKDGISGAIDIAARESWQIFGRRGLWGMQRNRIAIEIGNDELRSYLDSKRFYVHPKCKNTLNEFSKYAYPNVGVGREAKARLPVDEYNHAIKATIYLIIGKFGYRTTTRTQRRYGNTPRRGII